METIDEIEEGLFDTVYVEEGPLVSYSQKSTWHFFNKPN